MKKKNVFISNSEIDAIKIEALRGFIEYCYNRSFYYRMKVAARILFKTAHIFYKPEPAFVIAAMGGWI